MAVTHGDAVLAERTGDPTRTHAERLPGEISQVLASAQIARDKIDVFAVATGPGAFTGLRIGLATIQGLAMALQKPVVGVSALDALTAQVSDVDLAVPWMDAQRGEVFASVVDIRHATTIHPPSTGSAQSLIEAWLPDLRERRVVFIGDAVERDVEVLRRDQQWATRVPEPLAPRIAQLAHLAVTRGEAGPPHALIPIYVRKPDAEIERERRK